MEGPGGIQYSAVEGFVLGALPSDDDCTGEGSQTEQDERGDDAALGLPHSRADGDGNRGAAAAEGTTTGSGNETSGGLRSDERELFRGWADLAGTEGFIALVAEEDPFGGRETDGEALPGRDGPGSPGEAQRRNGAEVGGGEANGRARGGGAQSPPEESRGGSSSAAAAAPPWSAWRESRSGGKGSRPRHGASGLEWLQSPFLRLHQEILDFMRFVSPTDEEVQERKDAVERVSSLITSIWPSSQVQVFGSYATGLFLPSSDVDAVVLNSGCSSIPKALKALAKALVGKSLAKSLQVISHARVPIVKFVEVSSGVRFDISFDLTNGPDAATFIRSALAALPPLRPLCLVLKLFLQQRGLNEVLLMSASRPAFPPGPPFSLPSSTA